MEEEYKAYGIDTANVDNTCFGRFMRMEILKWKMERLADEEGKVACGHEQAQEFLRSANLFLSSQMISIEKDFADPHTKEFLESKLGQASSDINFIKGGHRTLWMKVKKDCTHYPPPERVVLLHQFIVKSLCIGKVYLLALQEVPNLVRSMWRI